MPDLISMNSTNMSSQQTYHEPVFLDDRYKNATTENSLKNKIKNFEIILQKKKSELNTLIHDSCELQKNTQNLEMENEFLNTISNQNYFKFFKTEETIQPKKNDFFSDNNFKNKTMKTNFELEEKEHKDILYQVGNI